MISSKGLHLCAALLLLGTIISTGCGFRTFNRTEVDATYAAISESNGDAQRERVESAKNALESTKSPASANKKEIASAQTAYDQALADAMAAAGIEQDCLVHAQLFYRSFGKEDSVASNKVCVLREGQTAFDSVHSGDFKLVNVSKDESIKYGFKHKHYCASNDASQSDDVCVWNGRFQESWPLSMRLVGSTSEDLEAHIGLVTVHVNGARVFAARPKDKAELVVPGSVLRGGFLGWGSPISIRIMKAGTTAAADRLSVEKQEFASTTSRLKRMLRNLPAEFIKQSPETSLQVNAYCMGVYMDVLRYEVESLSGAEDSAGLSDAKNKWITTCKDSEYKKQVDAFQKCEDPISGLLGADLNNKGIAVFSNTSLNMEQTDWQAQEDAMSEVSEQAACSARAATAALGLELSALESEVSQKLETWFASGGPSGTEAARIAADWREIVAAYRDPDVRDDAKQQLLRSWQLVLGSSANAPALDDAFEKLEEAIQVAIAIRKVTDEFVVGLDAAIVVFDDLQRDFTSAVRNEENALILYQAAAASLPSQDSLFVEKKANPAPADSVVWSLDAEHADRLQKFNLSTWNAVPINVQGSAYTQQLDASTAIPLVDLIGRRVQGPKLDLRVSLGVALFQEQLKFSDSNNSNLEFEYMNYALFTSFGLGSLRLGVGATLFSPYSERLGIIGESPSNADDTAAFDRKNQRLFGSQLSAHTRIFVGVDLVKLITGSSTGFSDSNAPGPRKD